MEINQQKLLIFLKKMKPLLRILADQYQVSLLREQTLPAVTVRHRSRPRGF